MLKEIERHPSACIQGHNFAVNKGAWREPFTCTGDLRELSGEEVPSSRPKCYPGRITASKTAVTVELNLVDPLLALGQVLHQPRIHRLDKPDFGGRQRAEGFGCHEECERSRPCCSVAYLITLSARKRTDCGIVTPICLAVLRLMMNSNFVGCSTGRSAGFAPFRILST